MRKLPVGAAFGHSVRSTINNLSFAFHASWPWMLVLLPINLAGNVYTLLNFTPPTDPREFWQNRPIDVVAVNFAMIVAAFVAFASIAVAWHRYILLDEVPRGLARLRLDGMVWRYVGNAIGISLLAGLASVAIMIPPALLAGGAVALMSTAGLVFAVPAVVAGFLLAIGFSMRVSIKLPAVAMGNRDITISRAMDLTVGNQWRAGALFGLVVLCLFAIGFAVSLLTTSLPVGVSSLALTTLVVVQMAVNWISTIWNVTVLTSLYGFFVEKRDF